MKGSTILFPVVRGPDGRVARVLLAMKKRGFGAGWYNGAGGKLEAGESYEDAAVRETSEEIGIRPRGLVQLMEVRFVFPHRPDWDQLTRVYLCDAWDGDPVESDEMKPEWFDVADVPYAKMWPSDDQWVPRVLAGEKLVGEIEFAPDNSAVRVDLRPA